MRVLFAASEMAPWVKTGGLADVIGALAPAAAKLGADVRVLIPAYPALIRAFPDAPVVAEFKAPGGNLPAAQLRSADAGDGITLLLLDCPACYAREGSPYVGADGNDWPDNAMRFGLLSRIAALLASEATPLAWKPDVLHCHDWQTALAPAYLHYLHRQHANVLLTVHNLAFQGKFGRAVLPQLGLPETAWSIAGVEFYGDLSFLKAGVQFAGWITTVSPTYAREIQTDAEGMGMAGLLRNMSGHLSGILNGIDGAAWNPATDPLLAQNYSAASLDNKTANKTALQKKLGLEERGDRLLFGVVSRLTHQKGLDLLLAAEAELLALPAQLAVLGSGEHSLEAAFADLARRHPGRVSVTIGFDEGLAHLIEAGADSFLMPSRFEPCGLNQMYSLAYGTPPVVRATGGLADTVADLQRPMFEQGGAHAANGFVFQAATKEALADAIERAAAAWRMPALWRRLQINGMSASHYWEAPSLQYMELYRRLAAASPT